MAGHSKWANIKFRKAAQDQKKGKIFTKLIKEITVATRIGGADMQTNPRLRIAIEKAFSANMTKDNIERAIKRGSGNTDNDDFVEIRYEGYAPYGVAVLVECATDNKNRTVSEVRHMFIKHGGNLGTNGSVSYLFQRVGIIFFDTTENEEIIFDTAIIAGATDVIIHSDSIEVITPADYHHETEKALQEKGLKPIMSEVIQRADNEIQLSSEEFEKIETIVNYLEELDDVQNVFTNATHEPVK